MDDGQPSEMEDGNPESLSSTWNKISEVAGSLPESDFEDLAHGSTPVGDPVSDPGLLRDGVLSVDGGDGGAIDSHGGARSSAIFSRGIRDVIQGSSTESFVVWT